MSSTTLSASSGVASERPSASTWIGGIVKSPVRSGATGTSHISL
jgi:hypothetical protein